MEELSKRTNKKKKKKKKKKVNETNVDIPAISKYFTFKNLSVYFNYSITSPNYRKKISWCKYHCDSFTDCIITDRTGPNTAYGHIQVIQVPMGCQLLTYNRILDHPVHHWLILSVSVASGMKRTNIKQNIPLHNKK